MRVLLALFFLIITLVQGQLFSNQIANTEVYCLGLDYKNVKEVGSVVPKVKTQ